MFVLCSEISKDDGRIVVQRTGFLKSNEFLHHYDLCVAFSFRHPLYVVALSHPWVY